MLSLGGGSFIRNSNVSSKLQGVVKTAKTNNLEGIPTSFDNSSSTEVISNYPHDIDNISSQTATLENVETVDFDELDSGIELNIPKGDWMFGDEAKDTHQYGGSQGRLSEAFESIYADDPKIMEIINQYYQDVSKEDLELLFAKMDDVGCGYMAAVDTLFAAFADKSPEEFYQHFGFYPTTERLNQGLGKNVTFYNYDYLFLDFFLYYAKKSGFTTIEDVYGNIDEVLELESQGKEITFDETGMDGTYENEVAKMFDDYLKERGIDVDIITESEFTNNNQVFDSKTIEEHLKNGDKIVVGGELYNLYEANDVDNNGKLDDIAYGDIDFHTVYLVGTTSDPNKVVISSWGEEYIMDISDITDFAIYSYN